MTRLTTKMGAALAAIAAFAIAAPASPAAAAAPSAQATPTQIGDRFYCEDRKLGTWFYCERPQPAEPEPPSAPQPATSAAEQLEAVTTELRELKARAILDPTPENVTAYIRFQRAQLDRASLFGDVWQRAIWQTPELDYTLQRPVGTLAKQQWLDTRKVDRDRALSQLGRRYGLFYFFAQSCGACEVMSPIVQSVASTWHIAVRAISTDGGPSRHFPNYTVETNQRSRMGLEPKITPAVVLWDARTGRPIPIGYGVISADELQDRIYLLTSKEAGRDY